MSIIKFLLESFYAEDYDKEKQLKENGDVKLEYNNYSKKIPDNILTFYCGKPKLS